MWEVEMYFVLFLQCLLGLVELCFYDGSVFVDVVICGWISVYVMFYFQNDSVLCKVEIVVLQVEWDVVLDEVQLVLCKDGLKVVVQVLKQGMKCVYGGCVWFFW